ncbi:MAG: M15 family metallopeptidase [Acidimicrobiia bacterium]
MTRLSRLSVGVIALVAFAALGYVALAVLDEPTAAYERSLPPSDPDPISAEPLTTHPPTTAASSSTSAALAPSTTTTANSISTYLVWISGGLPSVFVAGLAETFDRVSIVKGDMVELDGAGDGGVIPLDALALHPAAHRPFDSDGHLEWLRPEAVILGETSAAIRGLAIGNQLTIADTNYEVAAIVPDEAVAYAEVVFDLSDHSLPIATDRYALVATDLARDEFETAVQALSDGRTPIQIRSEGDTSWLRHADGVLPQVLIKQALGEFSYTNLAGSDFDQSSTFRDERIITSEVPVLGEVVCHETVTEMLTGAMTQLVDEGLTDLVDPGGFAGCWYPRFVRTASGSPAGVSRHAWGAAVDINAPTNPYGSEGVQDTRLVEIMQAWGFGWGGDWLVPDPMHFEFRQQP